MVSRRFRHQDGEEEKDGLNSAGDGSDSIRALDILPSGSRKRRSSGRHENDGLSSADCKNPKL
ncbi:hypothetical protein TIFTF001_004762 [Ficus carica]|uniref:Uncharacterized protein n=1 Tax=Ficus carica TaxID=3494 RepID=A0AA87ZZC1_FICCA|nr:hypothetical protein TIFTF001_004762 [Ficus carica]